jgi:tetraacyldisaccharide 4'-kinase
MTASGGGEDRGAAADRLAPPRASRSPWQAFYGGIHRLRRAYYRRIAIRLPRVVVSIGNLHWGGGGKTPLVQAVALHLRDRGVRVAVLSRGYGRADDQIRVASTGEGPLLGPRLIGDEPALLAGSLPGVAVVVGADRAAAGRHALLRLDPRPDLFLLDDGFSHLRLARDLDILAFPWMDPWAGGRLVPSGRLREPLASSQRAHAAVLTGVPAIEDWGRQLAAGLARFGFTGPGFASRTVAQPPIADDRRTLARSTRVVAVAAIARPGSFFDQLANLGFDVVARESHRDHHDYSDDDVARLDALAGRHGAQAILTTAKDAVKLRGRLRTLLAELPVRAEPESGFWRWLDDAVDEARRALDEVAPARAGERR